MDVIYSTKVRAVGGRNGHVESSDGLLKLDLALPKSIGGSGAATNPEQLFAAGYAACFENALRYIAGQQKLPLKDAAVEATVRLLPGSGGWKLDVDLAVEVRGLDQKAADALVAASDKACPYSNAIRGNVNVKISTVVG